LAADSTPQADGLESLAGVLFPNLSEAEKRLLRAAPQGELAICGPNGDDNDPANDPAKADSQPETVGWGSEREIRAGLIRWLCVDQEAAKWVDPAGVLAYGAKVTGTLDLYRRTIPFPLSLHRCRLITDCHLEFVRVPALSLNGSLTRSVIADGADVKDGINLSSGFSAVGGVRLAGARIGYLVCDRGHFLNPRGQALNANGAEIKSVFLTNGFSASGEVNLVGAHITTGNLECSGGSFQNPGGIALYADKAEIKGSILLKTKFSATGEVNLLGAHIGSNLECDGGSFKNPGAKALNAAGAEIGANVLLRDGCSAEGEINLVGAQIEGNLECTDARFTKLSFANMTVKQAFIWQGVRGFSTLDLQGVSVGLLSDDEASWPGNGNLYVDDFVYTRIAHGPTDAPARLRWLSRQRAFAPQPYRQLAKFLHDLGDDAGSKRVLYTLESRARTAAGRRLAQAPSPWLNAPSRCLRLAGDALSRAIIGYGIYPGRAIWFLCAMVALGWIIYFQAQRVGAMAPTDKDAYEKFHDPKGQVLGFYQPFTPLIYSLENSVPLLKFGQDEHWQPDASPRRHPPTVMDCTNVLCRMAAARDWLLDALLPHWITSPTALRWFRWVTIAVGWLLTTFFVAAVTGITKTGE
jgi:hypothetical protein